jgi:hypothetical protein
MNVFVDPIARLFEHNFYSFLTGETESFYYKNTALLCSEKRGIFYKVRSV